MQNNIFASHTFFGRHVHVNSTYKLVEMYFTSDTHFQGISDNICDFLKTFFRSFLYPSSEFCTHPQLVLPVQMMG